VCNANSEVQIMFEDDILVGEKFPHKVSAQFDNQPAANQAAQSLVDNAGFERMQIRVVRPHDPDMARKVEPEVKGIAKTLVKSHIVLGVGGLVLGLLVAAVLVTNGPALTRASPLLTFIALGILSPMLGLLIAGAMSLRPDHDILIEKTRSATDAGRWTLIAHCANDEEMARAKAIMHNVAAQTL
jgi:hypothetical protein